MKLDKYIPLEDCKDRMLYRIHSRNLEFGVYNASKQGFTGIREKFGDVFLFTEYHWDTGAPFGTVCPEEELEPMPENMSLDERIDIKDETTGRPVDFDRPIKDGGKGWYFTDSGEASEDIHATSVRNKALFEWLDKRAEHYKKRE